jgi:hypothetical protein
MEPQTQRPDAADDLVSDIVGLARPIVDKAIDEAALMALNAVLAYVDELRDTEPEVPDLSEESLTRAYFAGWGDGLQALVNDVRSARNRIQSAGRQ